MKKKIIIASIIICTSVLGIFSLNAANNRVKIVSENYATKQLSNDGMHITNIINTANTDLVNGNIAIDITIDNSKNTEIMYAIDNSNSMSSIKENLIETIKKRAKELEGIGNIKQGIVTTTDGVTSTVPLDLTNIEIQLDSVKTLTPSSKDGEIFTSIEEAVKNFSTSADDKNIVIFLTTMPSDITGLQDKINQYVQEGINIIAYSINLADTTNFSTVFDSVREFSLTTDKLEEITYNTNIINNLPKDKEDIVTTVSFDNYILNNFDIKDVQTNIGEAKYDETKKEVVWNAGNIKRNETVKLTYYLSLKKIVDESIIDNLTLRTNRQINVTKSGVLIGQYPSDKEIDETDDAIICSPTIMILKEAVDNPKTGVASYIVCGACMLLVGAITIIMLNRKNEFNRI